MRAIPQLVSAPLNPIPTVEHFRRSHPQCEHSYGQHIYMSDEQEVKKSHWPSFIVPALMIYNLCKSF